MSDAAREDHAAHAAPDAGAPGDAPGAPRAGAPPSAPPRRRRRWRRWLAILLILALVVRVALTLALPSLIAAAAASQGLDARYESLDLTLLGADVELRHLELRAQDADATWAHVEYLRADVSVLDALQGALRVRRVEVDGADLRLVHDADGVRPAGLEALAAAAPDDAADDDASGASTPATTADGAPAGLGVPASLAPPLRLDALRLQHVRLELLDLRGAQQQHHELELNLRLSDLAAPGRPARLSLSVTAPRLLDLLLVEGRAELERERATLRVRADVRGLLLRHWEAELAAAGLVLDDAAGARVGLGAELAAEARLEQGALRLDAQLDALELRNADAPPASLARAELRARVTPDAGLVVEDALLRGLRVTAVERDEGVSLLGLRAGETPDDPDDEQPDEPSGPAPRVRVTEARLEDVQLALRPAAPDAAPQELQLESLTLADLDTERPDDAPPGRFVGRLRLPGLLEELVLDGEVALAGPVGRLALRVGVPTVAPERLAAQLREAGLPEGLRADDLALDASTSWSADGLESLHAELDLGALRWGVDAEAVALPLSTELDLDALRGPVRPGGLPGVTSFRVAVHSPALLDELTLTGSLTPGDEADRARATLELAGLDLGAAPLALPADGALAQLRDLGAGLRVELTRWHGADAPLDLLVEGALLLATGASPRATFGAELTGLAFAGDAAPARLALHAAVPGDLRRLEAQGELALGDATRVALDVGLRGIALDGVAALLPPGVEEQLDDGRLRLRLEARTAEAEPGGQRLELTLSDLDYRAAGADEPWLALGRAAFLAPRLDPEAGVLRVDELAVEGLRARAEQAADGALLAGGFRLGAPPPADDVAALAPGAPAEGAPAGGAPAGAGPATGAPANDPTTTPAAAANGATAATDGAAGGGPPAAAPATSPGPAPTSATSLRLAHLERLLLELDAFTFVPAEGEPLVLRDLRLTNDDPLTYDMEQDEAAEVCPFTLTARLDPLGVQLELDAELHPFESEPSAQAELLVHGISGERLTAWRPALAERVDLSGLTDARLAAHVDTRLEGSRSGPFDLAFREGRLAELRVSQLTWRATPDGPVLGGLDGLLLRVFGTPPGSTRLHVDELALETPRLHVRRDASGLHLLGVRLPPADDAAAAPAATGAAAPDGAAASTGSAPTTATADPDEEPGTTLLLDDLRVSGLDFRFVDEQAVPPFHLPLQALDLYARGVALGPEAPARRMQGSLLVASGKVPNPDQPGGPEMRLFEDLELRAHGFPSDLQARLALTGLQLGAFEGAVADAGVQLEGGRLDLAVEARVRTDAPTQLQARARFERLELSESANGPIETFLRLPAPLDPVIFALRDRNGVIEIPLSLSIPPEGLSVTRIATLTAQTLGGLVRDALASVPLRVLGGMGSVVGLQFDAQLAPLPPLELAFLPGEVALTPVARARAEALVPQLARRPDVVVQLEHRIGTDDVETVGDRLLPPESLVRELVARLRAEHALMLERRAPLVAAAEAALAAGGARVARESLAALQRHETARGELLARLDELLGLIGRERERNAERNRLAGLLVLAEERLARVRAYLEALDPELAGRIRLRRPSRAQEPVQGPGELHAEFRRQLGL